MKPTLLILAAGMGSRYGGLKQVDTVGPSGETIMDYSIYDALKAGFGKVIFIIRKDIEEDFRNCFTNKFHNHINYEFVYQELDNIPKGIEIPKERLKPWGTGHAVMVASNAINEPFAVINADDFYGHDAFVKMNKFLTDEPGSHSYSMVGYKLNNTLSDFGFVSRGICETDSAGRLISVTERTRIRKEKEIIVFQDESEKLVPLEDNIIVSMNFWGFKPGFFKQLHELFNDFIASTHDSLKAEFYLSSAIDDLIKKRKAEVTVLVTDAQWFGVTYKEDKPLVKAAMAKLIDKGIYPEKLWRFE